jgi:hypothetical protein
MLRPQRFPSASVNQAPSHVWFSALADYRAFPCNAVTFEMLLTRRQYLNGIGLGLPTSIQLLYASTRPRLNFVGLDLDKSGTEDKSIAFAALLAMPTLRLCTIAGTRCNVGASNAGGRLTS